MLRSEILAELSSFSESHVLLECARLSGLRFALRGGIVRSLIVASALGKNFPIPSTYRESLFDLVDPFSDIDVVVDELVHWSRISTFIANALPLASYFRWEVSSLRQVTRLADTYERIPLDRFLLWFHPDGQSVTLDALDGMGDRTYKSLLEHKIEATVPGEWDKAIYNVFRIAAALKLIRYRQQFGLEGPDPLTWLNAIVKAEVDPTAMQRIEFHVLDVLFTAQQAAPALTQAISVLAKVSFGESQESELIKQIKRLSKQVDSSEWIRAIVYPSTFVGKARVHLDSFKKSSSPGELIPWTELTTGTITTTGTTDCCDFSGPIVVAVRPDGQFPSTLQNHTLEEMGVQARTGTQTESEGVHPQDLGAVQHRFAVPALHSVSVAGLLRIDPRYLRTVLGDNKKLQVSLQQVREPKPLQ